MRLKHNSHKKSVNKKEKIDKVHLLVLKGDYRKNPSKKFPENSQKISKTFLKDFESIQFPSSHLEAENPFGLVFY